MKTIKLQSENLDINQEYLVDLIGSNEQFSIYDAKHIVNGAEVVGVSDNSIKLGLPDKNVNIDKEVTGGGATHTTLSMTQAVALAVSKNLTMTVIEEGQNNVTKNTLTDFDWVTETLDNAISGVEQVEVLTFPTTAAATQGDYIIVTKALSGETVAIWLDIDDDGTEPTGADYVAADYKVKVEIVALGTAANTGAAVYAAMGADEGAIAELFVTDNEDGTLDFEQIFSGVVDEAVPKGADGTGVGSISSSTTAEGTAPTLYEMDLEVEGGSQPYVFTTESDLPEGITLSTGGVLSGNARDTATWPLTITVTDFFGDTKNLTANLIVAATA